MNFYDEIQKPNVFPIVLFEYNVDINIPYWFNKEAGVWQFQLTQEDSLYTDPDGTQVLFEYVNDIEYDRVFVVVDTETLSDQTSYANMLSQNKSSYYDRTERIIYIHLDKFNWYNSVTVMGAIPNRFTNNSDGVTGSYWGSGTDLFYYDPRLRSVPSLSRKKDPLFFGLFNYQSATIELDNSDGEFDNFGDQNLYGQQARLFLGTNTLTFDDFIQVHTGYIEDFTQDELVHRINIQDKRKRLSIKIPVNNFTQDEFPYLNDDNIDKPKPIAYGENLNCPTYCIDEELSPTPTNHTFFFLDTAEHTAVSLDRVWITEDDKRTDITASLVSTDLAAGTFTMPRTSTFDGDNLQKITCDFTAGTADGFDQVADLLRLYDGIAFTSDNYNLAIWNENKNRSIDIPSYIGEREELKKRIEKICKSLTSIFYPLDDGKYAMKIKDPDKSFIKTIYSDEWLNPFEKSNPFEEYLSSVVINYQRNNDKKNFFKTYNNIDYESEAFATYRTKVEKTFDLYINDISDVTDKSNFIMNESKDIVTTVTRKTKLQNVDLDIFDFIYASHNRVVDPDDFKVYEVIGVSKNLTAGEVTLTMRFQKNFDQVYIQGFHASEGTFLTNGCSSGGERIISGIGETEYREV